MVARHYKPYLDILGISPLYYVCLGNSRMSQSKAELLQGTLDMLILKALSLGELHGYGIIQRIQQISDGLLIVEQGSLYPALYRMEQQGWIVSEWGLSEVGRRAKLYKLTKAGRKQLTTEESNWNLLALAISKVLETS
jgi:PadR family transcriptional regulator